MHGRYTGVDASLIFFSQMLSPHLLVASLVANCELRWRNDVKRTDVLECRRDHTDATLI